MNVMRLPDPAKADPIETPASLALLLARVSGELAALADATGRLHDIVAQSGGETAATAFVLEAQGIDYCQQHLVALAGLLHAVAECTDEGMRVDIAAALASLPLSDLRDRLTTGTTRASAPSGELDLF